MKLHIQEYRRAGSRLNTILFFVAVLWLAASLLLLLLYRPGAAHAVQPRQPAHERMAGCIAPLAQPPFLNPSISALKI